MIHPEDRARLQEIGRSMSGGRTQQADFRVLRPDGSFRLCTGTAAASLDAADRVVRISGVTTDITDRKEAEGRQVLLAREVDHRARNALAVVQSIIRLTRAQSVDSYVAAVEGRIKALARAHALLSGFAVARRRPGGARRRGIGAVSGADADKVEVGGPNISLLPHMAQGLGLALHELATNAAKHGALSSMAGKVNLTWQLRPELLVLEWLERGGPRIAPPATRSFGLNVIRASVEQQLGGKVTFDWDPRGLQCTLSIPHAEPISRPEPKPARERADNGSGQARMAASRRVLLVEDEALVAMMIQQCLTETGHSIVGPISTASEALVTAKDGDFDAASSTSTSATGWPIQSPIFCRRAAFPSSSSPASRLTRWTIDSARCRSCRSRSSGRCCKKSSCPKTPRETWSAAARNRRWARAQVPRHSAGARSRLGIGAPDSFAEYIAAAPHGLIPFRFGAQRASSSQRMLASGLAPCQIVE